MAYVFIDLERISIHKIGITVSYAKQETILELGDYN